MNEHATKAYLELFKLKSQLLQLNLQHWKEDSLFTWEWWLLVGFTIVPLIIWWKVIDKKRAYEIAFFGCMINIFAVILDDAGSDLMWWGYPIKLLPIVSPLLTADSILVPIVLMFVYQRYSSSWKSFIAAVTITGFIIAFVAEPIFEWIGYYQPLKWKSLYSLLFYILASIISRFVILKIKR